MASVRDNPPSGEGMAWFWAVKKSHAPVYEGKSFSDTYFLRMLQPHALPVPFDTECESNAEIFYCDWKDGEYPAPFVSWAESQGGKAEDYFFLISRDVSVTEYDAISDHWPSSVREVWASWENIEGYCVAPSSLQFRLGYIQQEVNSILDKLQNLIY